MIKKILVCAVTVSLNSVLFGASSPSRDSTRSKALIKGTLAVWTALAEAQKTKILVTSAEDLVQWICMCKIFAASNGVPTGFTPPHSRLSPSYPASPSRQHLFSDGQKEKAATITIIRFTDHLPFDLTVVEIKEFFPNFRTAIYPGKPEHVLATPKSDDDSDVSSFSDNTSDVSESEESSDDDSDVFSFSDNTSDVSESKESSSESDEN